MAAVSDFFSIGSIVWCRTCYNKEVEGEVLAFDSQTKMLILKCDPTNGNPKCSNVYFINLSLVSELRVKKEVASIQVTPNSLSIHRINTRLNHEVDIKRHILQAIRANVSAEGQSLFRTIKKTMACEAQFKNTDIIVWDKNRLTITPPYSAEDVHGDPNTKEYGYLVKLVARHFESLRTKRNLSAQ